MFSPLPAASRCFVLLLLLATFGSCTLFGGRATVNTTSNFGQGSLASKVEATAVSVAPLRVGLPDGTSGFAYYSQFPNGTGRIGWNAGPDGHITQVGPKGERTGGDIVFRSEVIVRVLALGDGSLLVALVPFVANLDNALETPLALDIVRLDKAGRILFRTRVAGGSTTAAGQTWHAFSPLDGVRMANNGRVFPVFLRAAHNFAKPGAGAAETRLGDLYVVLDGNGRILPEHSSLFSTSRSNNLQMVLGASAEPVTLAVGDRAPFGIHLINRLSGKRAVIWPLPADIPQDAAANADSVEAAGHLSGLVSKGSVLLATVGTSGLVPYSMTRENADVLFLAFEPNGRLLTHTWITETSDLSEGNPQIANYGGQFLVAWNTLLAPDEGELRPATLAVVDMFGHVLRGPEHTTASMNRLNDELFTYTDGDAGWVHVDDNAQQITLYRVRR